MANIELRNLSKHFKKVVAVQDVNLTIHDKEFLTLLGPSGCGKTTILNMIAGLEMPTQGEIYIDGLLVNRVPAARRDVAMVFQNYALYPHMSVWDNMGFALKIRGLPRETIDTKVREAARVLEIESMLERRPRQLSGGQRQRVALGRALVRNPKVFLLDEPLSNLDATLRVQMRAEMKMMFNHLQATVVYVTHDKAEAMTMSDHIAIFRQGVMQQVDTPLNIYRRPINRFVASFVGSPAINQIPCQLAMDDSRLVARTADMEFDLTSIGQSFDLSEYVGREMVLGIRPEDLNPVGDADRCVPIRGSLEVVEQLGSATLLYINTGHNLMTGEASSTIRAHVGDQMMLGFPLDRLYLFDRETDLTVLSPGTLAN